jgi:ADP-dependent NAD(P)H-hydrate dehydratase / NAD(P)H-hydrate epimerase
MTTRPRPIFRRNGIRAFEAQFADVEPRLMERAGCALAALAGSMLDGALKPILIAAGPGNNGGDGLVAARLLKEQGHAVTVVFAGDSGRLPADARTALEKWRAAGGEIVSEIPDLRFALVVDALFGIGLTRPIEGKAAELIARINTLDCPVLAVDIPSGLDADTGRSTGPVVRATQTITFIALKPGLLMREGPDHCGKVELCDLGIATAAGEGEAISRLHFRDCLVARDRDSHKGSFGSVGVIGGAPGMAGATLLAGRAALKLGAGRVYVGMLDRLAVDPLQPELMLRQADEVLQLATVLAVGPGLGRSARALELLRQAIETQLPVLIDADGLNLLAEHPVLARRLARREAATLMTPHPAEAGRLLGIATDTVQADRLAAALTIARIHRAHVVLKGCGSIVATPGGRWFINTTGNPGLATGGSGDVLTGMIAALIAQGWPPLEAMVGGTHLHGSAADALVQTGIGPIGLTAGEIAHAARTTLNRWIADA